MTDAKEVCTYFLGDFVDFLLVFIKVGSSSNALPGWRTLSGIFDYACFCSF